MINPLLNLFYPSLCRHCDAPLSERAHLLCPTCAEHLVLAEVQFKCPYCFLPIEGRRVCASCSEKKVVLKKYAAACEPQGPSLSLLHQFRHGAPTLATALGSLMAMQVLQLNWPLPDLIIPFPSTRFQTVCRGYRASALLAAQVGLVLERPVASVLKSHFSLRAWLDEASPSPYLFTLEKGARIVNQRILLVADVLENALVRQAAAALRDGFPLEIYAMCFI